MATEDDGLTRELTDNIIYLIRARSSVAERAAHNRLVVGSNPAEPTFVFPNRVIIDYFT